MFAIIKTGGKQYKVAEGDVLEVELLESKEGDSVTLKEVLLVAKDSDVEIGHPFIASASVQCEVIDPEWKSKKVIAYKFRRRVGYHRTVGHRQRFTKIKVSKIISG